MSSAPHPTTREELEGIISELQAKLAAVENENLKGSTTEESPDFKTENFDFHELTAGLSNSLTDQIYRGYHSRLSKAYKEQSKVDRDSHSHGTRNDLETDNIAYKIRQQAEEKLVDETSKLMVDRVVTELKEQYHVEPGTTERFFDDAIKGIRWLMIIPFLCIALVMFTYMFVVFAETAHMGKNSYSYISNVHEIAFTEYCVEKPEKKNNELYLDRWEKLCKEGAIKKSLNKVIASVLLVLDLLLVGSLVIIVLVGGYENTISRIGISHGVPTWFGKFDVSQLKLKVAASIIIISSIQLLMSFMQLEMTPSKDFDFQALKYTAAIHGIFVLSGIGLAYMDRMHHK